MRPWLSAWRRTKRWPPTKMGRGRWRQSNSRKPTATGSSGPSTTRRVMASRKTGPDRGPRARF
eukprot:11156472-Lingulodinium_polyedra.AAC.1